MGHYGKLQEKTIALKLRYKGYSYSEILKKIKVSKDTLSRWCRDIVLTDYQKQRLINNKIFGQKKGSLIAAENKKRLRIMETQTIYKESAKQIGSINLREKFIAGISLYAGEGDKTDSQVGFSNSNPDLIKFMMWWFRKFCKISEDKYRGSLWLHQGLDEKKAKIFWANIIGIPLSQFNKTYIAKNKPYSKKIRKNIHKYGVFAIRFSNAIIHRRIMGWISALFHDRIPSTNIDIPL